MTSRRSSQTLWFFVALALIVIGIPYVLNRMDLVRSKMGGLEVGSPLPPLLVQGWVNGEAPTTDSLRGKVLVINAWAFW